MKETERKFIVLPSFFDVHRKGVKIEQGYIVNTTTKQVRVRIAGNSAELTIKGKRDSASRTEVNVQIGLTKARFLLETMCENLPIVKVRYTVHYKGRKWYVDKFLKENTGLVLAEIELNDENEDFEKPDWLGEEVTEDGEYYNNNLSINPYQNWKGIVGDR